MTLHDLRAHLEHQKYIVLLTTTAIHSLACLLYLRIFTTPPSTTSLHSVVPSSCALSFHLSYVFRVYTGVGLLMAIANNESLEEVAVTSIVLHKICYSSSSGQA
jgi:hypothetical protein